MLPWTLIIILLAMMSVAMMGHILGRKLGWENAVIQAFKDALWSSFLLGLIGGRIVFVLLHWDAYSISLIDILKIQDKGFHLIGGVVTGIAWFLGQNKRLPGKSKAIFILVFTLLLSIGIAVQTHLKPKLHFPELNFSSLTQNAETSAKVPLKQFIGQPTVINLWASWCPPCHREMPVLQQAHDQYPGINFIMLNQGEELRTVQDYLTRYDLKFKHVLLDPYGAMPQQMNMFGLPSTLFFNAQGQLIERHMGELTPAILQQYLKKISTQP
ncbi:TlpA family protein disulfide reductase [Acinetobacter sp. ANC 4779]|nr:TlpA family protein disulfide reductase [Acinetobacter sp. ANC 4779]